MEGTSATPVDTPVEKEQAPIALVALGNYLGPNEAEWCLVLDVFSKFQIAHKPSGKNGQANLSKQLCRILSKAGAPKEPVVLDLIFLDSTAYMQNMLPSHEVLSSFPAELRASTAQEIISDTNAVFTEVKTKYLIN